MHSRRLVLFSLYSTSSVAPSSLSPSDNLSMPPSLVSNTTEELAQSKPTLATLAKQASVKKETMDTYIPRLM